MGQTADLWGKSELLGKAEEGGYRGEQKSRSARSPPRRGASGIIRSRNPQAGFQACEVAADRSVAISPPCGGANGA